jgi:1-deoxyxylulose-5-phosphate synthase
MEYINLGRTGLKVSRICLGAMSYGSPKWREWVLDEETSRPFFKRALELGINFFDTADMYSNGLSEEVTGRALRDFARRDEVVIASKVFYPLKDGPNQGGLSRQRILRSVDDSLRRLGVDTIDLYQIHRYDPETPLEETLEALNDVVRSGKARYIGASSMYAWQFAKALYLAELHSWTRFVSMQNHYNLIYREEEREMIPLCIAEGIGIIPWSPLARGLLAGSRGSDYYGSSKRAQTDDYSRSLYHDASDFEIIDRVASLAGKRGVKPAQIALAWLFQKRGVSAPIIGATKMSHIDEAVAAVDIHLGEEEIRILEEPYQPHSVRGHS